MIARLLQIFSHGPKAATVPEDKAAIDGTDILVAPAAPAFDPLNAFEERLVAAAHDPAQRPAFNRLLLESTLFAASPDLPAARGTPLPPGAAPRISGLPGSDGQAVPALFTAPARLFERFGNGTGFFSADGARLLALVADHGALLNPGLGYGIRWTPADCAVLLGRPVERRREEDAQLLLGAPTDPPEALVAGLREVLASDAQVDGVWLALAQWPGREGLSWYLDVRTTLDRGEIERRLAPLFRQTGLGGRTLDLVVLPAGGEGAGLCITGAPDRLGD